MRLQGKLLFPVHILHALNALQHLRAMHILADCTDDEIYSTCEDIAREIGAPKETVWRALTVLVRAGLVEAKKGVGGGYYITAAVLVKIKLIDVINLLGREVPDNGDVRASDRLNNAVADCLDITLNVFFK